MIGHRKSAFTLTELLVVVAVIMILAALALPNFLQAQGTAGFNAVRIGGAGAGTPDRRGLGAGDEGAAGGSLYAQAQKVIWSATTSIRIRELNVLVAILKKHLHLEQSLYTILQVFNVTLFKKSPFFRCFPSLLAFLSISLLFGPIE